MKLVHRIVSIVGWIVRRDRSEQELDAELQSFVDMAAADYEHAGHSPAEARRLARLHLGGVEQTKERVRTSRHGGWLDEIGRDVRYAFRMFARNPAFAVIVVATLALGIGANTAIFSLIDALMLRWLPVDRPQELVLIKMQQPGDREPASDTFSYAIVREIGRASCRERV